ncbi:MAG: DUF1295 domain-containing protein [Candidatus Marinimicrobia bacterium]|nr:DUF1295 domain-containing protein [Candidatus Neomarinimicrobiota bacterium]MCF7828598.1 DUF1295 domain-containing protein [Candidatus Neomarinimicrobiota bacterium]MCF7880339.1 DUF1295 domain-containing protein [Candidatus Neomarinimicrobiota bacterium]
MVTDLFGLLGQLGVIIFAYVTVIFAIAVWRKDNGIMDVAWGLGFVIIAGYTLFTTGEFHVRQILVTLLTVIWGSRLSLHIYVRNRRKSSEDFRYRNWRERWGRWVYLRSYLQVFLLQGFLMIVFTVPVIFINKFSGPGLIVADYVGMIIWFTGFLLESVADFQLLRFKSNSENQGEIMTRGLWQYSRHPNYFGESLLWWGIWGMALSVNGGLYTVVSPVLLTFFLLRISGVPMLEDKYKGNPDYREYRERTNTFIPWFPKG